MIFSSSTFLAFFAAVLLLYAGASTIRQRAGILLAASLIFYGSWKPAYLLLLMASLAANYWIYVRLLDTRGRALLIAGVAGNLAVLAFYKYLGFLIENALALSSWLGMTTQLTPPAWVDLALPLGISFFTFHMLGAQIDVFRGDWTRRVSFAQWCLFVSYFPQFIAGPIVRAHEMFDQLEALGPLRADNLRFGALIFAGGLVKKALFADNIAPIVEELYGQPQSLDFALAWFATIAFSLQIYFDFSGYSEMAIGLARAMGVELPKNFEYPYWSRNFSEFWRRWHMTLSRWLRDYLYIPLGGSRSSSPRVFANLTTTMFLGGLWHGAGWTFVAWGLLHGTYLVGHRMLGRLYGAMGVDRHPLVDHLLGWIGIPVTYVLTCVTWVFFRAPTFHDAWLILQAMFGMASPETVLSLPRTYLQALVLAGAVVVVLEPAIVRVGARVAPLWWRNVPFPVRGLAYASVALLVIAFGGSTQKFIYFDF